MFAIIGFFYWLIMLIGITKLLIERSRPKQLGLITKLDRNIQNRNSRNQRLRITFNVADKKYDLESKVGMNFKKQVGDEILISYPQGKPSKSKLYNPNRDLVFILFTFFLGLIFIGLEYLGILIFT